MKMLFYNILDRKNRILLFFIVFFSIIIAIGSSLVPYATGMIVNTINSYNKDDFFKFLLILIAGILIQYFSSTIRMFFSNMCSIEIIRKLRIEAERKLFSVDYMEMEQMERAKVLHLLTDDIDNIKQFATETFPKFVQELVLFLITTYIVFKISFIIGLSTIIIYAFYTVPTKYFSRKQNQVLKRLREIKVKLKQKYLETFDNIGLIEQFNTEKYETDNVEIIQNKWANYTLNRHITVNLFKTIPRVLDSLSPAITFLIGGIFVVNNKMNIGEIVMIIGYLPYLNAPFRTFSQYFFTWQEVSIGVNSFSTFINLKDEVYGNKQINKIEEIQLKNVDLCTKDNKTILNDIKISLKNNNHIYIVGETGSGKSTLLKLLTGIIKPSNGEILINGVNISDLDIDNYRKRLAYITQQVVIEDNTIEANIFKENSKVSEEIVQFYNEWVNKFPEKGNTLIGEKGISISGGEKQIIAILRGLVKNPDLLLLDEVTASLDDLTSKKIHDLIDKIENKITIEVLHRIELLDPEDIVVKIEKGKINYFGKYKDME